MTIDKFIKLYAHGAVSEEVKFKLAKNPRTAKRILTCLSSDKNVNVRCLVAANLNTPKEVLTILSEDKDVPVRYNVVKNSHTPDDILGIMRDFDKCSVIVYCAAKLFNLVLPKYTNDKV